MLPYIHTLIGIKISHKNYILFGIIHIYILYIYVYIYICIYVPIYSATSIINIGMMHEFNIKKFIDIHFIFFIQNYIRQGTIETLQSGIKNTSVIKIQFVLKI